jgi:hypothetical protein
MTTFAAVVREDRLLVSEVLGIVHFMPFRSREVVL